MITDRIAVSACAEKQHGPGWRVIRGVLTASMAAILTLPSVAAWGTETAGKEQKSNAFETIALPQNPSLNSVPWLDWNSGVKIDTLSSPILNPSGIQLGPDERDREKPATS